MYEGRVSFIAGSLIVLQPRLGMGNAYQSLTLVNCSGLSTDARRSAVLALPG
jgi:hypothetical protein